MRPGETWPARFSIDSYPGNAGDADNAVNPVAYFNALHALEHYALAHRLWDGKRLPTIREQAAAAPMATVP
jgi:hypothetical protein